MKMNEIDAKNDQQRPEYVAPAVRVLNEAEVLSAFQVTAAGTTVWWAM